MVLDCENEKTTIDSICNILAVEPKNLREKLKMIDLEKYYTIHNYYPYTVESTLWEILNCQYKQDEYIVYWFHLTRVYGKFKEKLGILPLNMIIEDIWQFLYSLVKTEVSINKWEEFRKGMSNSRNHFAGLYNMKIKNEYLNGPFGILVKEAAFKPKEIGNHDYLRIPEIVEDICICSKDIIDFDLEDLYIKNAVACIVKFKALAKADNYLKIALYYLYKKIHNIKMSINSNTCYDNRGKVIPFEDIIKIEYLGNLTTASS